MLRLIFAVGEFQTDLPFIAGPGLADPNYATMNGERKDPAGHENDILTWDELDAVFQPHTMFGQVND
jgi:hypothetical protein